MPTPQLVAFNVTRAIEKQIDALDRLAKKPQPEDLVPLIGQLAQATMDVVTAWRDYLHGLDPEGWSKAITELEQLDALGMTRSPTDFAFLEGTPAT